MGYGGSYGGTGYGDGGFSGLISYPTAPWTTVWKVGWEVGLRGGYLIDLIGSWEHAGPYTVDFHLLGTAYRGLGLPGNGEECYPRALGFLPVITPPLPPGLYRVRITWPGGGELVHQQVVCAMRDDLPWHTFAQRRLHPPSVYQTGPQRAKEDV